MKKIFIISLLFLSCNTFCGGNDILQGVIYFGTKAAAYTFVAATVAGSYLVFDKSTSENINKSAWSHNIDNVIEKTALNMSKLAK